MSETLSISQRLEKAWEKVDDMFLPNNSWLTDQAKCKTLQNKLSYFNSNHKSRPEHIDQVYQFISRGVNLTQAAIDWENPAICGSPRSNIGKNRGIQWRLVIAYSGFEITTKGLMNCYQDNSIRFSTFQKLIKKCDLPRYSILRHPGIDNRKKLEKWLSRKELAMGNFLGLSDKDADIIQHWMVKSRPINHWTDAFRLAKAFRNTTTHGFLAPEIIEDWQIKESLEVLTENLAEILTAALIKLNA